ncbi:hypothetical protein BDZ94DRAFT_1152687 [Collybia nuda]|uniref:Uncharacterized protein n=1 Tax=Collybia nuda TaxID=64659 RepID=A0A9P5YHJ0_9AGAR|nr:hypothetical protein BDZ94DRAFT_1152687 [Collybia nuda]
MPRILPRLIQRVAHKEDSWTTYYHRVQRGKKSLLKPIPPRPSFNPANYARSILFSPSKSNPITHSYLYQQHKSQPPRPRPPRVKHKSIEYDSLREMTDSEHQWWSSPYLRMLASPIRKCIVTGRHLPSDFLIRIAAMRIPLKAKKNPKSEGVPTVVVPDGLQHSKFTARKTGRAAYILCNKDSIPMLLETNTYKRMAPFLSVPSLLPIQIAHLLRVRVLQEFELLADHLESCLGRPNQGSRARIVRRLTRDEWKTVQTTGTIPYPNAIAVLVVPPINKDPRNKERPVPSMSAAPPAKMEIPPPHRPTPPLSTLYPVGLGEMGDLMPHHQVPLYNSIALFPNRQQRTSLHTILTRLLSIDQRAGTQRPASKRTSSGTLGSVSPDGKKGSHAFLLSSDKETNKRGDVASLAIALWRVRMFG